MDKLGRIAVLADDEIVPEPSKTLVAILRYRSDRVVAVIDRTTAGKEAATVAGFPGELGIPVVPDVRAALDAHRPDAVLLADEPVGAALQSYWRDQVRVALEAGVDVVSGLHFLISDDPELSAVARRTGAKIHDLRKPPAEKYLTPFDAEGRPVLHFRDHRPGSRTVLAVGTDCSSGKMTTMLELERALREGGTDASFLATGQVGMMISGGGVAVDGLISDFLNSTVEDVVFHATQEHDVVLVEGQGALNHPRYSAVTLGLLHGTRPDAMVLCHDLRRTGLGLLPGVALPSMRRAIEINEQAARWADPERAPRVAGLSVVTAGLDDGEARAALRRLTDETGLPATDVLRYGVDALLPVVLPGLVGSVS
ncbi:DUF1611 domain-containing protein [Amycolatopsis roodepoortensis]|uniref:NAD-dependent epimerase/dehydratase family protein n=1 Tax=Amycolatopsis roodepoortensis TaxID=700274 RepID=A0ABR9L187_9PSEU|nr:DUF1611 domain-containing protein [Amycolatopsis roodepoortensis]MBE1574358.1 putative NAD-dependent epimerase/dehydratase family protein [Amycolatopsis roodepoortensis]